MIVDTYLNLLHLDEASKWKHLVRTLKIPGGKKSLRKIQSTKHGEDPLAKKAREKLIKAGKGKEAAKKYPKRNQRSGLKSHRKHTAGVNKGADTIIKKQGAKVSSKLGSAADDIKGVKPQDRMKNPMLAYASSAPGKRRAVHVATGGPKSQAGLRAQIKKHEADELVSQAKLKTHKGKRKMMAGDVEASKHASPQVLKKEKELAITSANLYGKKGTSNYLARLRSSKGEYREIPKGGRRAIRKMEKKATAAKAKAMDNIKKNYRKNPKASYKAITKDKGFGDRTYRKKLAKQITGVGIKGKAKLKTRKK